MVSHSTANAKKTNPPRSGPPASVMFEARPMVYAVRYCGAQRSSISAAIGQTLAVLDSFLGQQGLPEAKQLFVVYRNHIEGAVTIQAGYLVDEQTAGRVTGEILAGTTPSGPMVELLDEKTLEQILEVGRSLPESPNSYTWQVFEAPEFRPWTGKLVENLFVPADLWAQVEGHGSRRPGEV